MRPLLAVALALVFTGGATAANFTFTVNTPGPITAPAITLNGVDQTSTFPMQYTIGYNGTAGWNVQVSSTTLSSGANTLPAMKVSSVTNVPCNSKNCVDPTTNVGLPVTLSTTNQRIFNATAPTGQGTIVLDATFVITYPANALPGTYSAAVTITGSTGP